MATILVFRHGETQWNRARKVQGHTDAFSPLTLKGVEQSKAYGAALADYMGDARAEWRIMASPLARCVQTVSVLCDAGGLDFNQAVFDERLKEVGTGRFSGRTRTDLEATHPELFGGKGADSWYFRCPEGETLADLPGRLGAWLTERGAGEKIVVVTHGVAGKVLRALYLGRDPADILSEDSPQDAYFILSGGGAERRSVHG
jgi:probable phosphoglycerate mutase